MDAIASAAWTVACSPKRWGFPGAGWGEVMLSSASSFLFGDVGRKPDCQFVNR